MEFSYSDHEFSRETDRSSSLEANNNNNDDDDDHDQHRDILGTGRSYECVFCKRGFTTAQALGGHMNIHRKDKANKNKHSFIVPPSSSYSTNNNYADLRFYSEVPKGTNSNHYSTTRPTALHSSHHHGGYFIPAATAPSSSDWRQRCVREVKDNKVQDNNTSDENGLDLELRLGHHHRH